MKPTQFYWAHSKNLKIAPPEWRIGNPGDPDVCPEEPVVERVAANPSVEVPM
jgi:hypothetical protein